MNVRKVNARLFEDVSFAQNAAATAAAALALPGVFNKRGAVDSRQLLADAVLQIEQKRFH